MKRIKLFLILFFISMMVIVSCSKADKPQILNVNKAELQFPVGAAVREFNITSYGQWAIEADGLSPYFGPNMGGADWYTVEPIAGIGDTKIIVTSKENSAGNKATLKIKYEGKEKTVQLKQDVATAGE